MAINTLMIVAPTVVITASAVLYGYWLARRLHNVSDCDLCSQRSYDDAESDSPIFDAMDMEYKYTDKLTKPLNNESN
jgi:hypothetical protein